MIRPTGISALRDACPWPQQRPGEPPIDWALDAGGRQTLVDIIRERRMKVVVEVGVFLGGSVRRWLSAHDDVIVIAVDIWPALSSIDLYDSNRKQPDWVNRQLTAYPEAFYRTFLSTNWEWRDRLILLRQTGVEALQTIADAGVQPDLIYLDGDKSGAELTLAQSLFPSALLAGDDWYFIGAEPKGLATDEDYPIRKPVYAACANGDRYLLIDRSTWVILDEPPAWTRRLYFETKHHLKSGVRRMKDAGRLWWRRRKERNCA